MNNIEYFNIPGKGSKGSLTDKFKKGNKGSLTDKFSKGNKGSLTDKFKKGNKGNKMDKGNKGNKMDKGNKGKKNKGNKKDSKNSILSLIPWIIFGIILVVLGYFAFKFFVLNKSDDTDYEEYDVNYDDCEYDE